MKSVLLGNGVNIQFGGKAYTNRFIMERVRYRAKSGDTLKLFANKLNGKEIVQMLDDFVNIANDIRDGKYDSVERDGSELSALNDFKQRYPKRLVHSYDVMLEDWFFLVHMFFKKNCDLGKDKPLVIQGFEELVLDAIYNKGKIQELHSLMPKQVKKFFKRYDNIFTLNYDNNIETLISREVFHLHGDFSVLHNSENPNTVLGYIRTQENKLSVIRGMEHCFCNALLNYSGMLKYEEAKRQHELNMTLEKIVKEYSNSIEKEKFESMKPIEEKMLIAKVEHPELCAATEYHFEQFAAITDELHIVGLSPNNDEHIFNLILNNKALKKVIFYYFSDEEKKHIEEHYPVELFCCESVQKLWESLKCNSPSYNCNYSVPDQINEFIQVFNLLLESDTRTEDVLKEISQTPDFEIKRLSELVEEELLKLNHKNKSGNEEDFNKERNSIHYIALQEGVEPATLAVMYTMTRKKD